MRFFQPEEKRYVFWLIKLYFTPRWTSSGSQETLLGTGFWLDDKEKWTTNEWLFKCRYIFGAWCVACFVFHVSQNFDSTRVLDLFVLYFSISGKMKKILMKPWVPSVGNLEIVLLILISHTLCMHCDRIRDWVGDYRHGQSSPLSSPSVFYSGSKKPYFLVKLDFMV